MLIKIGRDFYIESKAIVGIQREINYLGYGDDKHIVDDVVIYTQGGAKYYYDGTIEELIKQYKESNNG